MKFLISPEQIIELAYSPSEQIRAEQISLSIISEASHKFLRPVLSGVYHELFNDKHIKFRDYYVKPALAYYVKYLMMAQQDSYRNSLEERSGQSLAASHEAFYAMKHEILSRANTLRDLCVSVIEADTSDEFAAYSTSENVTKNTKIIAGVVVSM